jgi:hypothetical protein
LVVARAAGDHQCNDGDCECSTHTGQSPKSSTRTAIEAVKVRSRLSLSSHEPMPSSVHQTATITPT